MSAPFGARRRCASSVILSLLFALVVYGGEAAGQSTDKTTEDTPGEAFFEAVDVEIVNIDVTVTDREGKPVDGLGRDDFEVLLDGKPTEVVNFYAVSGGRPVATAEEAEPSGATADTQADADGASTTTFDLEIAPEHRLWLIVYIDNYNIEPLERNRVLPAVARFLNRSLRPGDQAMLVTYSRALEVRQPFTDKVPLLHDTLAGLTKESGFATIRRRELMSTLRRIDRARDASQALSYARLYAEEQMNGVEYSADALQRLIDSLAGLPGRKALVHVSSGIPMAAGEELFQIIAEKFEASEAYAEIARHDTTRRFERVNQHANANRVSFYTVDAGGLRGLEFGNAEYGGFVDPRMRSTLDSVVPQNRQAPLRFMALETGGQAILNQNEILPGLLKAAQDFRSFYSLGIASSTTQSERYHEIKVKLRERQRGVLVRHRAGYQSKSTDTRVRERLHSALLYSDEESSDKVQLTWGRAEPHDKHGNYLLPIQLRIPLEEVVLLPTGAGRHELRLQLFVGAVGEDGAPSEIDSAPLGLRLADEHLEAAKKESLVHTHQLLVGPGRKRIGVAILDIFARESSVVIGSVQVGPPSEGESP